MTNEEPKSEPMKGRWAKWREGASSRSTTTGGQPISKQLTSSKEALKSPSLTKNKGKQRNLRCCCVSRWTRPFFKVWPFSSSYRWVRTMSPTTNAPPRLQKKKPSVENPPSMASPSGGVLWAILSRWKREALWQQKTRTASTTRVYINTRRCGRVYFKCTE